MPAPFIRARRFAAAAALACIAATTPGRAAVDAAKYHTHAELTAELQGLAKTHAEVLKLHELAKSRQGRSVWAVEIAGPGGPPADTRPGVLVVANLEGDGLTGSALALQAIDALAAGYASDPEIKKRLDSTAFYIVPRLNPDAAEEYFAAVKTGRRTTRTPFDDDNDGRVDEDGPEDLNKDGSITMMRVKDPAGPYMPHPDEPRLMKRADPQKGEAGGWAVYWEGVDNDGDGFYNEDGVGGADLDRNFQHQYPYYAPDAGRHMVSEPESRGLMDFLIKRGNVATVLTFGASDNLVGSGGRAATLDLVAFADRATADARESGIVRDPAPTFGFFGGGAIDGSEFAPPPRPPAPTRPPAPRPATAVAAPDAEYLKAVADKYKELTGIRQVAAARKPAGALYEWAYFQFGVPAFTTPGWGSAARGEGGAPAPAAPGGTPPAPAGAAGGGAPGRRGGGGGPAGPGSAGSGGGGAASEASGTAADDLALAKWLDAEKLPGFIAWTPFTHPTLGAVEIGGLRPYATVAPAAKIAELAKSHTAFILHLATLVPRLAVAPASVTSLGGGLYRIKADVENQGTWPTALQHAVTARAVKPVLVQLGVESAAIVSGHAKTNFLPSLAGSGRRQTYEWIVRGKPGQQVTLKAVAEKGGTVTQTLTLR